MKILKENFNSTQATIHSMFLGDNNSVFRFDEENGSLSLDIYTNNDLDLFEEYENTLTEAFKPVVFWDDDEDQCATAVLTYEELASQDETSVYCNIHLKRKPLIIEDHYLVATDNGFESWFEVEQAA